MPVEMVGDTAEEDVVGYKDQKRDEQGDPCKKNLILTCQESTWLAVQYE